MATEIKAEIPSIPPHLMPALLHDGDLTLAQELALAKGLAPEGILNDQTRLCRERYASNQPSDAA